MNELYQSCKNLFESKRTFVLTTHINPDGDGLGSEVALAVYLTSRKKTVAVINQSETPAYYRFMHSLFPIATYSSPVHDTVISRADVIIALDTNSSSRFAALKEPVLKSKAYKLCIDHHLDREPFADLYVINEEATATGEIIYDLLGYLDPAAVTPSIAEALYAAIMTDTGSFRFPKTNTRTHLITADLLKHGADPTRIYQRIFEEGPVNKLKLLGKALSSLEVMHSGAVATMALTRKDFAETRTTEENTDNMINHAMTVGGVKIALMFIELENGIKVSFRSKGNIPINQLAKEFGGNGHMNAAGARIPDGTLADVVKRVTERAAEYVGGKS